MQVIKKKKWSKEDLIAHGFQYHERKKQLVMARVLPPDEAPKTIVTAWDTLVAQAGYVICYDPGDVVWPALDDYNHWPCEPYIFRDTYRPWDEPDWKPSPTEAHLMSLGCKPCYKVTGVWAKKLTEETFVQSIESPRPVRVPPGVWIGIGIEGEPYAMSDRSFRSRYQMVDTNPPLVQRIIDFFRRR